jgi:uncharacterized protein (DUF2141 family)
MLGDGVRAAIRWIASAGSGLTLALVGTGSALGEPAPKGSTVTASMLNLRAQQGNVVCKLYHSEPDFPRGQTGNVRTKVVVRKGATRCVFKDVSPGTYAITVIHDENDNGKLDKNLIGMPTEGYGVSNNRTYAMKAPTWSECKFVVTRGKNPELGISLRY